MKRLRKRLEASGPGVVIAVIALIFALAGTAFAAAKLNGTQKKEVEKIAKKYAGKPGANGAPGLAGTAGAKGDTGTQGKEGPQGKEGEEGEEGPQGKEGEEGEEGSPWTAGGNLPAGANERGTWYVESSGGAKGRTAISFPIQLAAPLESSNIHIFGEAEFTTFCKGNLAHPKAEPGMLCIFTGTTEAAEELVVLSNELEPGEASQTGAIIQMKLGSEPNPGELLPGFASGSFAVSG